MKLSHQQQRERLAEFVTYHPRETVRSADKQYLASLNTNERSEYLCKNCAADKSRPETRSARGSLSVWAEVCAKPMNLERTVFFIRIETWV